MGNAFLLLIVRFTFMMHFVLVLFIRLLAEITASAFYKTMLGSRSICNLFKF